MLLLPLLVQSPHIATAAAAISLHAPPYAVRVAIVAIVGQQALTLTARCGLTADCQSPAPLVISREVNQAATKNAMVGNSIFGGKALSVLRVQLTLKARLRDRLLGLV